MEITVSLVVWLICISFSVLYQHYYATEIHIANQQQLLQFGKKITYFRYVESSKNSSIYFKQFLHAEFVVFHFR